MRRSTKSKIREDAHHGRKGRNRSRDLGSNTWQYVTLLFQFSAKFYAAGVELVVAVVGIQSFCTFLTRQLYYYPPENSLQSLKNTRIFYRII